MENGSQFRTTRWSVVLATRGDAPESRAALDELCAAYWYPLYAFLRRGGHDHEAASDLVQGFVAGLLERRALDGVDPDQGRFRAYLIGALQHHVANVRRAAGAEKRGGGRVGSLDLSLPHHDAATRFGDGTAERTPQQEYERAWALEVIGRAAARLREESEARGRGALFEALEDTLDGGDGGRTHVQRAAELGCSVGAVKVAAHRLRQRLGELIRDEVAQTVEGAQDVDTELQDLCAALGGAIGGEIAGTQ